MSIITRRMSQPATHVRYNTSILKYSKLKELYVCHKWGNTDLISKIQTDVSSSDSPFTD